MRPSNLLSLFVVLAAADVARYLPDSGFVTFDPAIEARHINCHAVTRVLAALRGLGRPATSFCSSYLQIETATLTSTITPPASITTEISTTTTTTTTFAFTGLRKRDESQKLKPLPGVLRLFAAAHITSACKCLQLPTPSATITITLAPSVSTVTAITTFTTTFTTCAAPGGPCECFNPGACCNLACSCSGPQGPVSTCL